MRTTSVQQRQSFGHQHKTFYSLEDFSKLPLYSCSRRSSDIEEIEEKVAALVGKENFNKIHDNFGKLDQSNGGVCSQGIWDIKKKEFPKANNSAPAAKKDVSGRLVTDPEGLKKVYKDTFINRLRVRPARESVRETLEIQEKLLEKRLIITSEEETEPWTENDVKTVLKSLKTGKSRDPLGLTNEVFKNEGNDLVRSLTIITNKVRDTCIIPEIFKLMNDSAIYKGKGSKQDPDNDRGVFVGTVPNTVMQKLVLKDTYDIIDENIGDSNVPQMRDVYPSYEG